MSLEVDESYTALVLKAALVKSNVKGTLGFAFSFETKDGDIDHELWITDQTRDRIAKTMNECFGVTLTQLKSKDFLKGLQDALSGKKLSITTEGDLYKGKVRPRVKWMNPFREKQETGDISGDIAAMFGSDADEGFEF